MWGLVLKDYYDSFRVRKNFWNNVIGFALMFAVFFIMGSGMYGLILIVGIMLPLTSSSVMQYSLEQEEIARFDEIALTYPVTRKEIIFAKFVSNLLFTCGLNLFSMLLILLSVFGFEATDFKTGMLIWAAGAIFSVFLLALNCVGFLWLGVKKGTFLYIAFVLLFAFGYAFAYFGFDWSKVLSLGTGALLALGTLIAVLALALSYVACVKIYTKKHS